MNNKLQLLVFSTGIVIIAYLLCSDHNPTGCHNQPIKSRAQRRTCAYDYFCSQSYGYMVFMVVIIYTVGIIHEKL